MKKVFAVMLVAIMVIGLTACGGSNTPEKLDATIKDICGHGGNAAYLNDDVVIVSYPKSCIEKVIERAGEIGSEFAKTDRDVLLLVAMNEDDSVYWGISMDKYNTDGWSEFCTSEYTADIEKDLTAMKTIAGEYSEKITVCEISDNSVQVTIPFNSECDIEKFVEDVMIMFYETKYECLSVVHLTSSGEIFAGTVITKDGTITQVENTTYINAE